jgi:hypothetical protein
MRPRSFAIAVVASLLAGPIQEARAAPDDAALAWATPALRAPLAIAAPAAPAGPAWVTLALGVEAGGAPLLRTIAGPVDLTTATTTAAVFGRLGFPRLTARTLEVLAVPGHGVGVTLLNGDLRIGPVALHLFDVGLFYDLAAPITVAREVRRWDAVLGAGVEVRVARHLALVADARLFTPIDVIGIISHNGDAARLVAEEIVKGAQLWGGAAWRW